MQLQNVSVFRLICAGTIEEQMYLRQIYKQQLDNVAVGSDNARRYFHGIQGSREHKVELGYYRSTVLAESDIKRLRFVCFVNH